MEPFDWLPFLRQWSRDFLTFEETRQELSPDVVESGWLGYPGATAEQLAGAEDRLGVALPPSYRAFLTASNGWRLAPLWIERLWSTEDIGWFAVLDQDWVDIYLRDDPDAYTDPHHDVRHAADQAVGTLRAAQAVGPLLDILSTNPDGNMASVAIARIGRAAAPELIAALVHEEERVRALAAGYLGYSNIGAGNPHVVAALTHALHDAAPAVRDRAAVSLQAYGIHT